MVLGTVSSSYFANNPGSEDKLPKVAKMVPVVTPEEVAEAMCKAVERKRAQADGVPAYVVFHDSTLQAIAERKPGNLDELAGVSGIGPAKLERYGSEILDVLS